MKREAAARTPLRGAGFGLLWTALTALGCGEDAPVRSDGSAEAPGTGLLYAMSRLGIAERTRGFDLDQACVATDDCVDNRLHLLGAANTEIQALLDSTPTRLLLELSGLDATAEPPNDLITVRIYLATPTESGGYRIAAESLRSGAARSQAPAELRSGQIRAQPQNELELFLGADEGETSYRLAFRLALAGIEARLSADQSRLDRGLIGGALTIPELASRPNPFCGTLPDFCQRPDQTLLDLIASGVQPDIDMPPANGLERIETSRESRRVSRCLDGEGQELSPSSEVEPWTCALRDELQDGYSIAFDFEAERFEGTLE